MIFSELLPEGNRCLVRVFVMNGLVSLATALFCSDETWTLYNGVISYVLIGMMFTAEYIIRIILRKRRKSGTDDTEKL